jgi:hypothetical protein
MDPTNQLDGLGFDCAIAIYGDTIYVPKDSRVHMVLVVWHTEDAERNA